MPGLVAAIAMALVASQPPIALDSRDPRTLAMVLLASALSTSVAHDS